MVVKVDRRDFDRLLVEEITKEMRSDIAKKIS